MPSTFDNARFFPHLTYHALDTAHAFLAAHDNGVIVFKLERERPAFSLYQDTLFYVQNKMVRMHDLSTGSDVVVTNVKKLGPVYAPPLSLSYNPAEKAILISEVSQRRAIETPSNAHAYDCSVFVHRV